MKNGFLGSLALAVLLQVPVSVSASPIPAGGLLANGDFSAGLGGWSQSGNSSYSYVTGGENPLYAAGPVGSLGYLSQSFFASQTGSYSLSFDEANWLGWNDGSVHNQFQVLMDGSAVYTEQNADHGWQHFTYDLWLHAGTHTLTFAFRNDPSYVYLDNVSVTPPPSVVPLPAAAWLFGSALLALAGLVKRRKSA